MSSVQDGVPSAALAHALLAQLHGLMAQGDADALRSDQAAVLLQRLLAAASTVDACRSVRAVEELEHQRAVLLEVGSCDDDDEEDNDNADDSDDDGDVRCAH
jgi:hypothetical protein